MADVIGLGDGLVEPPRVISIAIHRQEHRDVLEAPRCELDHAVGQGRLLAALGMWFGIRHRRIFARVVCGSIRGCAVSRLAFVLVLVSGAPGSGKTTLARPVARILGLPLIGKDPIKEAMADVLGPSGDQQWSSRLGAAAFEVMWAIARDTGDCVLDGNFGPKSPERILQLSPQPIEIFCSCPTDEILRRFLERARARHPIHMGVAHLDHLKERLSDVPPSPLNLGPVLEVDTSRRVDAQAVAAWVREQIGSPRGD